MSFTDTLRVVWQASPETQALTRTTLANSGAEVQPRMGFDSITIITVVAAVATLAKAITQIVRDHHYHGVMVDITTDPIEIREMPSWDRGHVLVVGAGGAQFHSFDDPNSLSDLIQSLRS